MNTRPLTLADIFLEVLEQWFNDDSQKAYVRKVKTLMNVPECAEFLSISLMNAMGHPTRIAVSTIDKAVNCLTHFYEDNIKENQELTREQKNGQKELMKGFMNDYCQAVKVKALLRCKGTNKPQLSQCVFYQMLTIYINNLRFKR